MTDPKNDVRLVDAFQLMWGNFPDAMMLVHRDRTVLAMNDAASAQRSFGIGVGDKCFKANPAAGPNHCQGCRANEALREGTTIACDGVLAGKRIRGYWIPLKGSTEVYVHGYSSLEPAELRATGT